MDTRTLVTAEELLALPEDFRCELIDGEILERMPTGGPHGYISIRFGTLLDVFVEEHDLGVVNGGDLGYLFGRNPDTVRAPDVSFVSYERLERAEIPETGYWPVVPDLVVEVLSPSERPGYYEAKLALYLAAGVRLVWYASPPARTITVYSPGAEPRVLREGDTLDGGEVLPGFSVPVAEVFRRKLSR